MNAESIERWLAEVGIAAEVVSVGAERDNAWCLLADEAPDTEGIAWEVFWREQGNRYDWARFDSEHVACHYLFGRLVWAQVARGAVGVVDSVDTGRHTVDPPADESDTGRHPVPDAGSGRPQ